MSYLSHQNQAFSPSHIRSIIPIFREKAERVCILQTTHQTPLSHLCPQLRDIFLQLVDAPSPQSAAHSQPVSPASPPPITVNVLTWLGRATLDVIGEAGTFLYQFRSVPLLSFSSQDSAIPSTPSHLQERTLTALMSPRMSLRAPSLQCFPPGVRLAS
jgi:hypothetical protein